MVGRRNRAVRVRALAGDIVLCSCSRHFTLTVPLSTQVYLGTGQLMLWATLQWASIPSQESRNAPRRFLPQKPELSVSLTGHLS